MRSVLRQTAGPPMGCDIYFTNYADADQDGMDTLLTLFATGGGAYIMGIPSSNVSAQ